MRNQIKKFLVLIIFILTAIFLIRYLQGTMYFDPMYLRAQLESYGYFSPVIFILIYIFGSVLLVPGTILTIAGGILFGTFLGTLYTIIGATIGATLLFLISRSLGRSFIHDIVEKKYKTIKEYDKKIEKNGFKTILFLRLVPLFPFVAINVFSGLTKVKLRHYFLGTLIGIIPGSFALAYLGDSLAELKVLHIILSIVLILILLFSYHIWKKMKNKIK